MCLFRVCLHRALKIFVDILVFLSQRFHLLLKILFLFKVLAKSQLFRFIFPQYACGLPLYRLSLIFGFGVFPKCVHQHLHNNLDKLLILFCD